MTREKLENEIEFKRKCIFYTERVIKNPPTDSLSKDMLNQASRLKEELSQLETQLAGLGPAPKKQKNQVKRRVTKTKRRKK